MKRKTLEKMGFKLDVWANGQQVITYKGKYVIQYKSSLTFKDLINALAVKSWKVGYNEGERNAKANIKRAIDMC
jgi:hypothetical protein